MKATFENTVDILVKAYLNNTLVKGNCFACAVGNIVGHNLGVKFIDTGVPYEKQPQWAGFGRKGYPGITGWATAFHTNCGKQIISGVVGKSASIQIKSTGYSMGQLAKIEFAFETGFTGKDSMFNGLMAVVSVLAEIHNVSLEAKESAKLLFVNL